MDRLEVDRTASLIGRGVPSSLDDVGKGRFQDEGGERRSSRRACEELDAEVMQQ